MEKTGIILMGAGGRMGHTIGNLLKNDHKCFLACAVERSEKLPELSEYGCPLATSVEEAISMAPNAVIVDFTSPDASINAVEFAARAQMPIVIGTTGFTDDQMALLKKFSRKTPLLWSANMSIGINALKEILPFLVRALGPDYDIEITEIHHRHKRDSPSGTALMLGEAVAEARDEKLQNLRRDCRSGMIGPRKDGEIGIQAIRGGEVVGVHTVWFLGPAESIEITHRADSRENFARGALRAAAWLKEQAPGRVYEMRDVLAISEK